MWVLAAACLTTVAGAAEPTGLMIDLLEHPERGEVSSSRPTLTWIVPPEVTAISAYRIEVTSGASVYWDSGKVHAASSISVPYGGPPLEPDREYAWRVWVWDAAGNPAAPSKPQPFKTAPKLAEYAASTYRVAAVEQKPESVRPDNDDVLVVDFGRSAFGWLELEIDAARPADLTVRLGEKLSEGRIDRKPGGHIRYAQSKLHVTPGKRTYRVMLPADERNTGPDAIAIPEEFGVVLPFRWAEVEGIKPGRVTARRQALFYPFDETTSFFRSSDATLNAVWDLSKYSIAATTFAGLYVDGDRERIPYEADAYINQLSHYNVDREFTIARATHEYLLRRPTWPTEWKQHSVMIAWQDYLHTGDPRPLAASYDVLKAEKIFLDRQRPDGLVNTEGLRDIVDWPVVERDGYDMRPVNTVVNAFFFHTMELMEKIARVLGRTADAEDFATRAQRSKDAINAHLFDAKRGVYVDGEGSDHASQHASFFPLAFGVVPKDRVRGVVEFLESRGMACSVYGAQYLLEALYLGGADEAALKRMTAKDDRSWQAMIDAGSTMTLEAWNSKAKPNLDWNHAWGAAPANIIPRFLMGMRPLEPGFGEILIEPRLGSLEWAEAKIPTIRGPVQVRVEQGRDLFQVTFEIPGNTRAKVSLPDLGGTVTLDGVPVEPVREGDRLVIADISSGRHRVEQHRTDRSKR